jgi:amidohydrolase
MLPEKARSRILSHSRKREETPMHPIPEIAAESEELTGWRRDLHAHPELGFEEKRTSDFVAERLASFGCEVFRGIAGTGLVGRLKAGTSARAIALRADMDALPIEEENELPYRSRNAGRMHACGHDGHTTMLLGAARHLAATRRFDGTVHFIYQPAEEGLGGAKAMLGEGLFERFPCEAVFGMHNAPGLAPGKFALRPGAMMAGGGFFDIAIAGRGAHGARPEASIDPVIAAAHIATALQTIVSRNLRPVEGAVLSVTRFHAGDAYNVIPQQAQLGGTARAFSEEGLKTIEERIRALAKSIAAGFGATAELDFRILFLPLVNDPEETAVLADAAAELVGEENVERHAGLVMASEDFSFMLKERPGAYIRIGNGERPNGAGTHNPGYDFNDAILPLGASLFARLVERRLAPAAR